MAKTCIVCSGPAGSGEHVFPASLGGRRINRGIYCTTHDNGYSGLVNELAGQLDVFNSLLGVRPDHSDDVKSARGHDGDGAMVELSAEASKFAEPRVISEEPRGECVVFEMAFPDQASIERWRAEQEAMGRTVTFEKTGQSSTYFVGPVRFSRGFGGSQGLGAVAYVTQTFLAQEFPVLARTESVRGFIDYTQAMAKAGKKARTQNSEADEEEAPSANQAPIWWEFEPQPDQSPNHFSFGHRVTVGVDASDGQIYGRLSLFSSLHFSMIFGFTLDAHESRSVTIDIDPLANHPPDDVVKTARGDALTRVVRPQSQTAGLARAVANDDASRWFDDLLKRMIDHSLAMTAGEMAAELTKVPNAPREEAERNIRAILEPRSQRVFNLMQWFVNNFKNSPQSQPFRPNWPTLDALIERDPASPNGLSSTAAAALVLAKEALLAAMVEDHRNGRLDSRRFAELMGEGPGVVIVGAAILQPVLDSL